MNSAVVRTRDQLHIHVGCLVPYARATLAAAAPKVPMVNGRRSGRYVSHTMFLAYRIPDGRARPGERQPVPLAAEVVAGKTKDPGDLTVVVVGVRVDSEDQFLTPCSPRQGSHAWWPVGADNLLGDCRFAGPRRAG